MARCYAFPVTFVFWALGMIAHLDRQVASVTGSVHAYHIVFLLAAGVTSALYIHEMNERLRSDRPGDTLGPTWRRRQERAGKR
jgi:hypothetical protein